MKAPRPETPRAQADLHLVPDGPFVDAKIQVNARRWWDWRSGQPGDKASMRVERDRARGYSINVKQVLLAFAVEFVIIGLILTGQFIFAAQLPNVSQFVVVQTLLFPIALAMVELARVPLAIAVRTQRSWNIQLAALVGVLCAVVVTSASLYQIGNLTFNPRLEAVYLKRNQLDSAQEKKAALLAQKRTAEGILDQKLNELSTSSER
jgi:hypothetical protein